MEFISNIITWNCTIIALHAMLIVISNLNEKILNEHIQSAQCAHRAKWKTFSLPKSSPYYPLRRLRWADIGNNKSCEKSNPVFKW